MLAARVLPRQRLDAATLGAIYLVALTFIPSGLVVQGIPLSITPATLVALVMTVCWICAHLTTTLGMAKGRNPVRTALYLYTLSLLATYGYAAYRYLPDDEIKLADHSLVLIIALIGIGLLLCDGMSSRSRLDFVLRTAVVACTFIAAVGALQFVFNLDLTRYLSLPGLRFPSISDGFVFERVDFRRVTGTTGNPIEFGVTCAMAMPLALHYGFRDRANGKRGTWWWVAAGIIASGLLFSVSRSAVIGMVCAGLVLMVGWPARRRLWALGASAAFLVFAKFAFPGLLGTFVGLFANASSDSSVAYRTHDYPIAAAEIAKSLWLGRGVGTFYAPKHIVFDNQYLLTLVEGGVIGLAAMLTLFIVGLVTAVRCLLRTTDQDLRSLALALTACLVVPVVGSFTFDLLSFKTVTGLLFVVLGCIGCLYRLVQQGPPRSVAPTEVASTEPAPAPA